MRALIAILLAALFFTSAPASLSAHGPEGHGEGSAEAQAPAAEEAVAATEPDDQSTPQAVDEPVAAEIEPAPGPLSVLKNLHPAAVHLPIGLLVFATLAELVSLRRRSHRLEAASEITAVVGGVAAAIAALFGWIHTGIWMGGGADMQLHRWIGTGLGFLGPVIAWLALHRPENRSIYRVLLAVAFVAILAQSYLGAELGHGAGHLFK